MAKNQGDAQKKENGQQKGRHVGAGKDTKRKLIPPFVMLAAGAAAGISMVMRGGELREFLANLLLVLFLFYLLGCILKGVLDWIEEQNAQRIKSEEEVIEKGPEEAAEEIESLEETAKE